MLTFQSSLMFKKTQLLNMLKESSLKIISKKTYQDYLIVNEAQI